jgi:hypothetical protein
LVLARNCRAWQCTFLDLRRNQKPQPRRILCECFLDRQNSETCSAFLDKLSTTCAGDVYFLTGIRAWSGEVWADTGLESRFLSYAAQSSELFPEVNSVGEVRVFHITREAASLVAGASCQAGYDSYWMIRPRLARHGEIWANELAT